jgi:hypothetical protein
MPLAGFEPTIPVFKRAKTFHALDRAATVTGTNVIYHCQNPLESTSKSLHPNQRWCSSEQLSCVMAELLVQMHHIKNPRLKKSA